MQAVMDHVSMCRSISQQLEGCVVGTPKNSVPLLLTLYEFESKLLLNHHELHSSLERALHIPSIDAKALETMAALCVHAKSSGKFATV